MSDNFNSSKLSENISQALQRVIDTRYKYLREKNYENHRYASKILKEEHQPALEEFKRLIDILIKED